MAMITKDDIKAVEALIAWMQSQEIEPDKAIEIMAATIVVACLTMAREEKWDKTKTVKAIVDASESIIDIYRENNESR